MALGKGELPLRVAEYDRAYKQFGDYEKTEIGKVD